MHRSLDIAKRKRRAAKAGLVYINGLDDGIRRVRCGRGFTYKNSIGVVKSQRTRRRISALVIPPAWRDVIICTRSNGHLQAVGVDQSGRRQYVYHPQWTTISSASKFNRMHLIGERLPTIRRRVARDLNLPGLCRPRVIAAVIRLLDKGHLRVGNAAYARSGGGRGATTLSGDHVRVDRTRVRLDFPGKSGQRREVTLDDPKVARVIRRCEEIQGQFLFQYMDDDGTSHSITSTDVNTTLKSISGEEISAKDFRTWWGSVIALDELRRIDGDDDRRTRKRKISAAIDATSRELGNTKAVCRSSYIHPGLLVAAESGELTGLLCRIDPQPAAMMSVAETRFLQLLPKLEFT